MRRLLDWGGQVQRWVDVTQELMKATNRQFTAATNSYDNSRSFPITEVQDQWDPALRSETTQLSEGDEMGKSSMRIPASNSDICRGCSNKVQGLVFHVADTMQRMTWSWGHWVDEQDS